MTSRESEFWGRHLRVAREITGPPAERSARVASLKVQRQSIITFLDAAPRSGASARCEGARLAAPRPPTKSRRHARQQYSGRRRVLKWHEGNRSMLSCPPSYAHCRCVDILSNGGCLNCVVGSPLSKISAPDLPTCNVQWAYNPSPKEDLETDARIFQVVPAGVYTFTK
jgi:hypothetical protein